MDILKGLDLFSGIGGITLALRDWVRPVAYCEIEPYCQSVLLQRMQEGYLPKAPIWNDVRTLRGCDLPQVDIITGGFPCQDISVAGRGKGLEGERSGLFFEIMRLAEEIKPQFLFLENVPAITSRGGLRVVREIAERGYDCRWCVISASSVGALHKRERWFLLAYSKHNGSSACEGRGGFGECSSSGQGTQKPKKGIGEIKRASCISPDVANSSSQGLEGFWDGSIGSNKEISMSSCDCHDGNFNSITSDQAYPYTQSIKEGRDTWGRPTGFYWPFESRADWQETVCKMDKCSDGIPRRMDCLKALGNAVVPQQVKKVFMILSGMYHG